MSILSLSVRPDSYLFESHEYSGLTQALIENERATLVTPVSCLNDLLLTEQGTTVNGFRYSDVALAQAGTYLAPGLTQSIYDISGQFRNPKVDKKFYSGELAVDVFNRLIKLRYDKQLCGLQLIKNVKTKTIDGLAGAKYRYMANSDFLDRAALPLKRLSAKFHLAFLYGRQLVIRHMLPSTTYNIAGEEYSAGLHFANAEIGGQSIRAAIMLIRNITGDSALGAFTGSAGGRVAHKGRDFEKKLHSLLDGMLRKLPPKKDVEEGGRLLDSNKLLLDKDTAKRSRQLTTAMARKKLSMNFAKKVVSSTAARGKDQTSFVDALPGEMTDVLASRSSYDLFTSLIREARTLPIDQREVAEQFAYSLLTGKYTI
jgi:hypothetical protein